MATYTLSPASSTSSNPGSGGGGGQQHDMNHHWHRNMQEKFLNGQRCDMTIVIIMMSENDDEEDGHTDDDGGDGGTVVRRNQSLPQRRKEISCHSLILEARSQYISACLNGPYKESESMKIEIQLADEQAIEDFRLLIKLSYVLSYVEDDGRPLPKDVLLRLALLGDAYEFTDCVRQCMESFGRDLSYEEAMNCLDDVPIALQGHDAVENLRLKAMSILANGVSEPSSLEIPDKNELEKALDRGAGALCKYLGPIKGLFQSGLTIIPSSAFEHIFPKVALLHDYVTDLPLLAFKRILNSPDLQCETENETFTLLVCWLFQTRQILEPEARPEVFKHLARNLHFHHLSNDYLANIISLSRLMYKSGLLPVALQRALVHRSTQPSFLEEQKIYVPPNRGRDCKIWEITTELCLIDLLPVKKGEGIYQLLGIVGGYPVYAKITYHKEGTLGVAFGLVVLDPNSDAFMNEEDKTLLPPGVAMQISYKLGSGNSSKGEGKERIVRELFQTRLDYGHPDYFEGKSWTDVVYGNSPFFPAGRCVLEATFTFLSP